MFSLILACSFSVLCGGNQEDWQLSQQCYKWKAFWASKVNSASPVFSALKMGAQTLKQLMPFQVPIFNHVAEISKCQQQETKLCSASLILLFFFLIIISYKLHDYFLVSSPMYFSPLSPRGR